MNQDNKFSPFIIPENTDMLAMKTKKRNGSSSKKSWGMPFLFLVFTYMAIQCYFIVRAKSNSFLFTAMEISMVTVSFIFAFIIIKIKKESKASKKEVGQLKELLLKKNRSIEDLVLLCELQQSKLISTVLLKEKLISIVSHDMRIPLNAFKKLMSDYEKGLISPRVFTIGVLETKNELNKIDDMTIDLLNLSENEKAGSGEQMICSEKISEMMDSTLLLYKRHAKNKKIDIIPYIQLPANMCLCIPMAELEIIIRSLISNAIKFSNDESIIIITLKAEAGSGGSVATLSVKDFGKGMRPSTLNHINGSRAVGMNAPNEGSLGTGLRIVFDLINNNNLQYNIESDVEKGTKFSVNIPLVTR